MTADIIKLAVIGVVSAVLVISIREKRPDFAVLATIGAGTVILFVALPWLSDVMDMLRRTFAVHNVVDNGYITVIIKIIGIAYIAEFGGQICADAGSNALAANVELAGKIAIIAVSAPIILDLFNRVMAL